MPATIFVWNPHNGQVGHASMSLDDGTYISWWPTDDVLSSPAQSFGMRKDKEEEGSRMPDYVSASIMGLNDKNISEWWASLSGRQPGDVSRTRHEPKAAIGSFELFNGGNCSNMVVRGLVVGGVETVYPIAASIIGRNPIMSPLTLKDLAEAITGDFGSKLLAQIKSGDPIIATTRTIWQYFVSPKLK